MILRNLVCILLIQPTNFLEILVVLVVLVTLERFDPSGPIDVLVKCFSPLGTPSGFLFCEFKTAVGAKRLIKVDFWTKVTPNKKTFHPAFY